MKSFWELGSSIHLRCTLHQHQWEAGRSLIFLQRTFHWGTAPGEETVNCSLTIILFSASSRILIKVLQKWEKEKILKKRWKWGTPTSSSLGFSQESRLVSFWTKRKALKHKLLNVSKDIMNWHLIPFIATAGVCKTNCPVMSTFELVSQLPLSPIEISSDLGLRESEREIKGRNECEGKARQVQGGRSNRWRKGDCGNCGNILGAVVLWFLLVKREGGRKSRLFEAAVRHTTTTAAAILFSSGTNGIAECYRRILSGRKSARDYQQTTQVKDTFVSEIVFS